MRQRLVGAAGPHELRPDRPARTGKAASLPPLMLAQTPSGRSTPDSRPRVGGPCRHQDICAGYVPSRPGRAPPGRLFGKLPLPLLHPPVAPRFVLRSVRFDLRPAQCHAAQLHQTRLRAQLRRLPEQRTQRIQMPFAEIADRAEIRTLHRRHHHRVIRRIAPLFRGRINDRRQVRRVTYQIAQQTRTCPGGAGSCTGGRSMRRSTFHGRWVSAMPPIEGHLPTYAKQNVDCSDELGACRFA